VNNLNVNYIGGVVATGTNCGGGVNNGPVLIYGELTVNQSNTFSPTFRVDFNTSTASASCTIRGDYRQEGRLGSVANGTWSCTGIPNQGVFTLSQLEGSANGFSGRFFGTDQFCTYNGYFGGTRDVL
jgi:hypothetical protein